MERTPRRNVGKRPGKKTQEGPSWEADPQMVSFSLALPVCDLDIGFNTSELLGVITDSVSLLGVQQLVAVPRRHPGRMLCLLYLSVANRTDSPSLVGLHAVHAGVQLVQPLRKGFKALGPPGGATAQAET